MATITKGKTFTNGELVTPQKLHELVDLGTVSGIVNADISASAAIADTKLAQITTAGKVANSATTATNANTANAIVVRDASGNFSAGTITAALSGNATTATTLQTDRTINGVSFNGSANITVTADPNAHTHTIANVTGLQTALDGKQAAGSYVVDNGASLCFRNKTINGNFDIWQRGTSFPGLSLTTENLQKADRWICQTYINPANNPVGTYSVSRQTCTNTELTQFQANYYQRLQNNITSVGTTPLNSSIDSSSGRLAITNLENTHEVLGKTMTLSFWARASAPTKIVSENQIHSFSQSVWTPTICKTFDLTTTWQKFTHTYTMPTYAQVAAAGYNPGAVDGSQTSPTYTPLGASLPPLSSWVFQIDLKSMWSLGEWRRHGNAYAGSRPSGFEGTQQTLAEMQAMNNSFLTDGYYDIAQIQLEVGSVATPFEHRPIGTELALCQRYFCKSYDLNTTPGSVYLNEGNPNVICSPAKNDWFPCSIRFPVDMHHDPSLIIYRPSVANTTNTIENTGEAFPLTVNYLESGSTGIGLVGTSSNGTSGASYQFQYTADAEI